MKVSWFSPLPPAHTEIGNVTGRLLPALSSHFELSVFTSTKDWDSRFAGFCPVTSISKGFSDWKGLHLGGVPVYHIGNNIHFHEEIITVALKCPGIVVLHDLALHETILNLCLRKGSGRAGYFDILHRHYGSEAVDKGRDFLEHQKGDINDLSVSYPLFEYVLENALGVITHNPLNAETIRNFTPAPILYAPLPFTEKVSMAEPVRRAAKVSQPYKILVFGFLGSSNRRLHAFLKALSASEVRDYFSVTIGGTYPESDVKKWIRDLDLKEHVNLKGYLSDEELEALLHSSDLIPNLRWPSRGESSGTLLRIWNHSLPALVTDTAFYSTLPRDTVAFVDPQNEEKSIQGHLSAFVKQPETYFAMGLSGRKRLEEQHSSEVFIEHLKSFIPEVNRWKGCLYPQIFGRRLVKERLADYPHAAARMGLITKCTEELATWYDSSRA